MKRKGKFSNASKELRQLKYEALSVPKGSVRLVKKTKERKSSTQRCPEFEPSTTKDPACMGQVPVKSVELKRPLVEWRGS
ncbi:hypothetical protein TNCV_5009281 [Trichonephila clavipes]|nr:hypothetical protein TNCV_5009281 [Trichonephila clavipes]